MLPALLLFIALFLGRRGIQRNILDSPIIFIPLALHKNSGNDETTNTCLDGIIAHICNFCDCESLFNF